jgi:TRAP-type C4-dicarboxylate transport system substrate-binding protein
LRRSGIRLINSRWNWFRGLEWVLAADRPIVDPVDLRGLKVRTPESDLMQRFWQLLGAKPVPVPWVEVATALRAGEVEVLPTHKTHLYPLGFCRHARYVTRLGDLPPVLAVGMNDSRFQVLPPAIQAGLQEACDAAGGFFSNHVREAEIENQQHNIRRYRAVYLTVDLAHWREAVARARARLVAEGLVDAATWAAVGNALSEDREGDAA